MLTYCSIIVISADNDEFERAKKEEQMPEHTRLVSALMIRQLSVLVAKMDCNGWDENSSNKTYQRNRTTVLIYRGSAQARVLVHLLCDFCRHSLTYFTGGFRQVKWSTAIDVDSWSATPFWMLNFQLVSSCTYEIRWRLESLWAGFVRYSMCVCMCEIRLRWPLVETIESLPPLYKYILLCTQDHVPLPKRT